MVERLAVSQELDTESNERKVAVAADIGSIITANNGTAWEVIEHGNRGAGRVSSINGRHLGQRHSVGETLLHEI